MVERVLTLLGVMHHALASAWNRQQPLVELRIPMPTQVKLFKGGVEGWAMTIHLGVGQGAIHIPKHRLQSGHGWLRVKTPND